MRQPTSHDAFMPRIDLGHLGFEGPGSHANSRSRRSTVVDHGCAVHVLFLDVTKAHFAHCDNVGVGEWFGSAVSQRGDLWTLRSSQSLISGRSPGIILRGWTRLRAHARQLKPLGLLPDADMSTKGNLDLEHTAALPLTSEAVQR